MKEQFIPYTLALKLKERGFNEECLAVWDNQTKELFMNDTREINQIPSIFTLAPLWQQGFDWFADFKDLYGVIEITKLWRFNIYNVRSRQLIYEGEDTTYEEARLKCLTKLLK